MIGTRVKWRHTAPDGKPVLPVQGVVVSCDWSSTTYRVLLRLDDGTFKVADPADLIETQAAPEPTTLNAAVDDCHDGLEKTVRDLGLWEDNGGCAGMQAAKLLQEFMSELRAKDEELTKLKKKADKKAKTDEKKEGES